MNIAGAGKKRHAGQEEHPMRTYKRITLITAMLALLAVPAFAGEIALFTGYGATDKPVEKTYAWQAQYMEGLGEHFAYSIAYLNQGHFISHHRDANAASLWARTNLMDKHLSLGIGAGGLFYYDTIKPTDGTPPSDFHGWGTIASVAATWYTESRVFYQLQGNWVRGGQSFDTLSALVGIGYQLDAPPEQGPDVKGTKQRENTTDNEITVFGGQSIVNIPGPPGKSTAAALEYRRGLWRYLEWTARGLYEGKNDLTDRYGVTSQLWLAKEFLDDRVSIGAGLGGYFGVDQKRTAAAHSSKQFFAEVASITGSVRLSEHWDVRGTWDRTITGYDRDTDIFLGGLGYRF
jgi:hypothetical protein